MEPAGARSLESARIITENPEVSRGQAKPRARVASARTLRLDRLRDFNALGRAADPPPRISPREASQHCGDFVFPLPKLRVGLTYLLPCFRQTIQFSLKYKIWDQFP